MKISIITPTIRKDSLALNKACLQKQTFTDYEWIVISPYEETEAVWVSEPSKREGDFYNLNKCWNRGISVATGDLIVSIVDLLWFPPTTLELLWRHYTANPTYCIGLIGHQYKEIQDGKPDIRVWSDPRKREGTSFFEIPPYDLEVCIASLPKKGIYEVGGFDEEFDKFPAWSEKELCCRMEQAGYRFFIDQSIEYRALYHDRLNKEWDKLYPQSTKYFNDCYSKIHTNQRFKLDFLAEPII